MISLSATFVRQCSNYYSQRNFVDFYFCHFRIEYLEEAAEPAVHKNANTPAGAIFF